MDCRNGDIVEMDDNFFEEREKRKDARHFVPLTEKQYNELKPIAKAGRKGRMRNQPCPCGSGIKFKRCCWEKHA